MQGQWRDIDASAFAKALPRDAAGANDAAIALALDRARGWFHEHPSELFVCGGRACRDRLRWMAELEAMASGERPGPLPIAITDCQGPCKQAPVATLRITTRCTMFAQVSDDCDWRAVLEYGRRAAAAGTLLVDPGEAQSFAFDPVHDHERVSVPLQRLAFLVGHFSGEGSYSGRTGTFQKEVVGTWEAGGRFIGLRMAATYTLQDGRKDVHHALVLVGYNDATGSYEARAYTDSGTTRDYHLMLESERVTFSDRAPGHVNATAARKILTRSASGYLETLEIQRGEGEFETYSTIELSPVKRTLA